MVLRREQHVGRLHVPVHEAMSMRGVECCRHLCDEKRRPTGIEGSALGKQRCKIGAFNPPHGDEHQPALVAGLVNRDHIRVIDRSGDL